MPSLVVIGQQMKEKRRGHNVPPSLYDAKYPSLNRVKNTEACLPAKFIHNSVNWAAS